MRHGSLFSGIGGFDLAAEWIGWENIFHVEINEFCRKVLNYYWPNAKSYEDITKTDFTIWRGKIDIITGGFPCQPYSIAGKRKGTEDDRHLWPEMLRAIREIQPSYIVAENVYGLINWNRGLVSQEIQANLEAESYQVQSIILPARAIGAPHRRDRVWFIAYSDSFRCKWNKEFKKRKQRKAFGEFNTCINSRNITNNNIEGLQKWIQEKFKSNEIQNQSIKGSKYTRTYSKNYWREFPTQSPIFSRNDGLSCKLDGITISKWREESIKALGNAIVPQIAYEIFKVIDILNK